MKKQKLLTSLTVALAVTGCTTTPPQQDTENPPMHAKRVQVLIYDSSPRPKAAHFDIYETKEPQRPYKVIALLTCEGAPKEEAAMMTAIFYRAQLMGADAVMSADTAYTRDTQGGILAGASTRCVFRAKAIVYEDK